MKSYKISIIIPCYNSGKYLNNLFTCLDYQTFKDYEIIFIDDGSTDDTYSKLELYGKGKNNVKIIKQENKGQSCARNIGLYNSNGEFIYFCDSDDSFDKNLLFCLYKNIESNNYDASIINYKKVKADFNFQKTQVNINKGKIEKFCGEDNILSQLLSSNKLDYMPWNKLYKLDVLKKMNNFPFVFDEEIKFMEDVDFNVNYFALCSNVIYSNLKLYNWTFREGGVSYSSFSNRNLTCLKMYKNFDNFDKTKYREAQIYFHVKKCIDSFFFLYLMRKSKEVDFNILNEIYKTYKDNLKYFIKGKRLKFYFRFFMQFTRPYAFINYKKHFKK